MTNKSRGVLTAGLGLLLAAAPLLAHHSFSAEFDGNQKVTIKGAVTKVEWMNPHAWFYVDAKDDAGNVAHWQFEIGPPNQLSRRGWRKRIRSNRETRSPGPVCAPRTEPTPGARERSCCPTAKGSSTDRPTAHPLRASRRLAEAEHGRAVSIQNLGDIRRF